MKICDCTSKELEDLSDAIAAMEVLAHEFAYGPYGDQSAKKLWGESTLAIDKVRAAIPERYRAKYLSARHCRIYRHPHSSDQESQYNATL